MKKLRTKQTHTPHTCARTYSQASGMWFCLNYSSVFYLSDFPIQPLTWVCQIFQAKAFPEWGPQPVLLSYQKSLSLILRLKEMQRKTKQSLRMISPSLLNEPCLDLDLALTLLAEGDGRIETPKQSLSLGLLHWKNSDSSVSQKPVNWIHRSVPMPSFLILIQRCVCLPGGFHFS